MRGTVEGSDEAIEDVKAKQNFITGRSNHTDCGESLSKYAHVNKECRAIHDPLIVANDDDRILDWQL